MSCRSMLFRVCLLIELSDLYTDKLVSDSVIMGWHSVVGSYAFLSKLHNSVAIIGVKRQLCLPIWYSNTIYILWETMWTLLSM